jgi:putative pyoverdin transport system ATP-binding/permease protein
MKLLRFLFRISRSTLLASMGTGILAGSATAAVIVVLNSALSHKLPAPARILLGFVAFTLVMLLCNLVSRLLLVRLSQNGIFELRMSLCRAVTATELRHLEVLGSPRIMAALTDDIQIISNALLGLPPLSVGLSIIAVSLVYLGWLSPSVLLALLGFMGIGVAVYQFMARRALKHLRAAREEQDALFRNYRSMVEGAKELKLHRDRCEDFLESGLSATASTVRRLNLRGLMYYTAAESNGQFLFFAFIGLLLFVLPVFLSVRSELITSYAITLLYVMTPLQATLNLLPVLARAKVSMQKIEQLQLSLAVTPRKDGSPLIALAPLNEYCLELNGITHSYRTDREDSLFVLGPMDAVFRSGEIVFIVGGNGSGKTTLAKVITGLYAPESGEILLNGNRICPELNEAYRQHFSAVFSDFCLFDSLLGFDLEKTHSSAQHYLRKLHLDHKVKLENGRFSTTELSQGQKKRLALLVAFLEDRPFYLFDEWASDQDPLFKEVFYRELLPDLKHRGKGVIAISHDDRYFHLADRVIKLEYGQAIRSTIGIPAPETHAESAKCQAS